MSMVEPLIAELEQESEATRRLLERVPEEKLDWRPHEKSMSLGQLALHIASTPGAIAGLMEMDEVPPPDFGTNPLPGSKAEVLAAFEESLVQAREAMVALDDDRAMATWRVVDGGEELMALPRIGLLRAIMLNHWYHHRGQLTVYLRMLDVPLPAVYGASADENAFAPA